MAAPATKTAPRQPQAKEAGGPRGLSEQELAVMNELMARYQATQTVHQPAIRIGEPYEALANLAVPRRNDPDHKTDLVMRGETVYLTPEEAATYTRCDPRRDGRRAPAVRRLHGPESRSGEAPLPPIAMSGALHGPPLHARPDPRGSSTIEVRNIPEATPPVPGSEASAGQETVQGQRTVDALDLPPSRAAADIRDQVDPAILSQLRAGVDEQEQRGR